jgi:hypothetical protein
LNIVDVFTFFVIFSRTVTSLQSLRLSTLQVLHQGHSCSFQYKLNFSWCSLQCSLISNTYDGNFWYSAKHIVVWPRDSFTELRYSVHFVQSPSSHSWHQTSDGLDILHIPLKDGELDMMLISCNILLVLKWKLAFINYR